MRTLAQMRLKGRQDSGVRDRETGYDRLNGLNDGEADLDESAPQAEGDGSEAYLRGVQGPSGEYHFPTHRLRTTMKGRSHKIITCLTGRRVKDPPGDCGVRIVLTADLPPPAYV